MRGGFGRRISSGEEIDYDIKKLDRRLLSLLLNYVRPHWRQLLLCLAAVTGTTLTTLLGPYLIKVGVDDYLMQGRFQGLTLVAGLMVGNYLFFWFCSYWQRYLAESVGERVVNEIRNDLYQRLEELPYGEFTGGSTGDYISRVIHDVETISQLISNGLINLLADLLTLLGLMAVMLYLSPRLALLSFTVIPVIYLLFKFLGRKIRRAQQEVRQKLAEMNIEVEENLSGIRVLQALRQEERSQEEFSRLSWENVRAHLKAVTFFGLLFPAMNLSRVLGEAIVLVAGGYMVTGGSISIGLLLAFLSYVRQFFAPLADLSQVFNLYQEAAAALERIGEYLIPESESFSRPNYQIHAKKVEETSPPVRLDDLSYSYGREQVLQNLNLTLEPGEIAGIQGRSGSGKTTLARLLAGLLKPEEKSIYICGHDITEVPETWLQERVGSVSQNPFIFNMSVLDNIRLGQNISAAEIEDLFKDITGPELAESFSDGIRTEVGEEGEQLSGGQKKIIELLRLLVRNPDIVILDEPTSSLDLNTEKRVRERVMKYLDTRSALIISHQSSLLEEVDSLYSLSDGSLLPLY